MGDPGYTKMGSATDTQFTDQTGKFQGQLDQLNRQTGNGDPQAWMNQFLASSPALANMVSGQMSPLQQQLNALAGRQARLGGEAALASMPGAQNSGAGMAAYGQAYADPFAQAQAQIAGKQLDLTGGLWNNALGGYNTSFNNANSLAAGMAGKMGDLWSPTYQKNPGVFDYLAQGAGLAGDLAGVAGGLGWKPFAQKAPQLFQKHYGDPGLRLS